MNENVTNDILDNIQQQNYELIRQNEKIIKHLEHIHGFTNFIMFIVIISVLGILILFISKFEILMNIFETLSDLL